MSSWNRPPIAIAALLGAACAGEIPSSFTPRPAVVEPAGGPRALESTVAIRGSNFFVLGVENIGRNGGVTVVEQYRATLGGVPLRAVQRINAGELRATVPAGLPAGAHELVVVGPYGLSGRLERAWTASDLKPSKLSAVAGPVPAQVNVGQDFRFLLEVTNAGEADAASVAASISWGGSGRATLATSPAPLTVRGGGGKASLAFTVHPTLAGPLILSSAVAGVDVVSGATVGAAPPAASVLIQRRAALSATLRSPTLANQGQSFTVDLTVANGGEVTARSVTPGALRILPAGSATILTSPPATDIAGGQTKTFSWTVRAGASLGRLDFTADASGLDANDGAPVPVTPASATSVVQRPASLAVSFVGLPPRVNVGQVFTVAVAVANAGDSDAVGVTPAVPAQAGVGAATIVRGPVPSTSVVPGQRNQPFSFDYRASSPGTVTFTTTATGSDAVEPGTQVTSPAATSTPLAVQRPSALAATLSIPSSIVFGSTFPVTLLVTNTGEASATLQAPSSPIPVPGSAGAASLVSGPVPGTSATLAGGASQRYTWVFTATQAGSLRLSSSVAATDANDGSPRSAASSSEIGVIVEVAALATDPFVDGASFSYILQYQGQIWLGPSLDGAKALRMNPDGSGAQPVTWQLEVDNVAPFTAGNPAYAKPGAVSATIGGRGCTPNTLACGPDNENGVGLFFSGLWRGVEWLGLAGGTPGRPGTNMVYMTNTSIPLVAGADHFAYVDLGAGILTNYSTLTLTAAHLFHDRLYLGFLDNGARSSPVLDVLVTQPSLPGLEALEKVDAVGLGVSSMPGFGTGAAPANPASQAMVDAIADFGNAPNDALYIANNGAWYRSTNQAPAFCSWSGPCPDWTEVTPTDAAYRAFTSVTPLPPFAPVAKTKDLRPSDRAVPAMASFAGRLFAARNTTAGPQLWVCTPTAAANTQCGPGDWKLIAPNVKLAAGLTQFDNPNNTSIAFVAATRTSLYVGFDNAVDGIVVYRTGAPAAAGMSDFYGAGDCVAGPSSCQGIGSNGFGAVLTQIADAKVMTFGGSDSVYLVASTASGPARAYRIAR
ncbi:MAG: hypothetical protein NVS2B9_01590 [Myxococcales bacterium]